MGLGLKWIFVTFKIKTPVVLVFSALQLFQLCLWHQAPICSYRIFKKRHSNFLKQLGRVVFGKSYSDMRKLAFVGDYFFCSGWIQIWCSGEPQWNRNVCSMLKVGFSLFLIYWIIYFYFFLFYHSANWIAFVQHCLLQTNLVKYIQKKRCSKE